MRIGAMKAVDGGLGPWLCSALSLVAGRRPQPWPTEGLERIAVCKFWGMGSLILATPSFVELKARHPKARLTLITQSANRELVPMLEGVDDALFLELGQGPVAFLRSLGQLVRAARAKRFQLWVDLEFATRFSALVAGVSGAELVSGFEVPEVPRGRLHDLRVPFNPHLHIVDNFAMAATGELSPPARARELPRMRTSGRAAAAVANLLEAEGWDGRSPYLVVNPNAGELALERRWPIERFAQVAQALAGELDGWVVLVGAPAEKAYVATLREALGRQVRVADLSGATSLPELAALFAGARLLVSNDTGPLHLACAVGTPTVSIFGPEHPGLFGPRGPRHRWVSLGLGCTPCLTIQNGRSVHCRFERPRCVTELGTAPVLGAAFAQLAAHPEPVAPLPQPVG